MDNPNRRTHWDRRSICDIYPAHDIGGGQEPESQSRIDLWFEKHVAFEMRPYPADIRKRGDFGSRRRYPKIFRCRISTRSSRLITSAAESINRLLPKARREFSPPTSGVHKREVFPHWPVSAYAWNTKTRRLWKCGTRWRASTVVRHRVSHSMLFEILIPFDGNVQIGSLR